MKIMAFTDAMQFYLLKMKTEPASGLLVCMGAVRIDLGEPELRTTN